MEKHIYFCTAIDPIVQIIIRGRIEDIEAENVDDDFDWNYEKLYLNYVHAHYITAATNGGNPDISVRYEIHVIADCVEDAICKARAAFEKSISERIEHYILYGWEERR